MRASRLGWGLTVALAIAPGSLSLMPRHSTLT
jgi:hypothetical protein